MLTILKLQGLEWKQHAYRIPFFYLKDIFAKYEAMEDDSEEESEEEGKIVIYLHRSRKGKKMGKIVIILVSINFSMCFGCSKEPSHRDDSFEYPQHMFWLCNKKNGFWNYTVLSGGLRMLGECLFK